MSNKNQTSSAIMEIVSSRPCTVVGVQRALADAEGITDPRKIQSAFRAESIEAYLEKQTERKRVARWYYGGELFYLASPLRA